MKALFVTVVFISALTSVINPVLGQGLAFVSNTNAVGNGPSSVIAVDIKGDGKLDLVCTDSKDNTLTVLTNDGSGGFVSNATTACRVLIRPASRRRISMAMANRIWLPRFLITTMVPASLWC